MIIDSHSHVILPVEKHLDIMIKEGVEKTVLFSTLVHPEKMINEMTFKGINNQTVELKITNYQYPEITDGDWDSNWSVLPNHINI